MLGIATGLAKNHLQTTVPILFGGRLAHQFAHRNFRFLEEVVTVINQLYGVGATNAFARISTAEEYLQAVKEGTGLRPRVPERTGDVMPFVSDVGESWTGVHTSRPYLKLKLRDIAR